MGPMDRFVTRHSTFQKPAPTETPALDAFRADLRAVRVLEAADLSRALAARDLAEEVPAPTGRPGRRAYISLFDLAGVTADVAPQRRLVAAGGRGKYAPWTDSEKRQCVCVCVFLF